MNKNRLLTITLAIALALSLGGRQGAVAQRSPESQKLPPGGNNEVSINFDNAPIIEVIDIMSRVTGKNLIVDPSVKGTVTVIAPERVPKSDAYGVFESILEMNGFSLVPMGNIIKVVPSRSATQKSIPVRTGRAPVAISPGDQIITQLIPIQYSDAQAITTVLTPLISRDANLTAYANTNTIIITETASNIDRLLEIVREIDVPGFEDKITIIPLLNAQADVLAQEILQALEPGPAVPGAAPPRRTGRRAQAQATLTGTTISAIKIIPDARTNSLIVVANEMDTEQVEFLARELDKATPVEANNIHVYRLENSLAEDVAQVLTSLATTATPAGGQPGGAGAPATSGIRTFYKEVSVVADKTTNSLIVIASPQDYVVLRSVIEQLDVMRPQVLVETLIAEVSLEFSRDLGINWQFAIPDGDDKAGFGSFEPFSFGDFLGDAIEDPSVPVPLGSGLSLGYINVDADFIKALVNVSASEDNDDFNVLSAPHLLTLDNEKAVINISDNVPFITTTLTDTGGDVGLATSETFEYRDVGIILEITPHISPDRMVRLEIVQKVNEVAQVSASETTGDVLSEKKREAETTVVVKDRHTLVLGGLMKDTDTVNIRKVPFLGDIPILGWAFKTKSTERKKQNLLIFITPSIVADVDEATDLMVEKAEGASEDLRERLERSPTLRRSIMFEKESRRTETVPHEAGPK